MADIINIKNEMGEVQYPITKPECVIDENGKNVRQELTELSEEVDKKVDVTYVDNAIQTAITNELNADF